MKALFLIQGRQVAASRYRALQYIPGLSLKGLSSEARRFPRGLLELPAACAAARDADVLFLQRKQLGPVARACLRWSAPRLVYDFDDALWVRSSRHADNRSRTRRARFRRMAAMADEVVAGNSYLAEQAARFNPRVTVIPSPVDTSRYRVRPEAFDPRSVTVGWIGAHASIHYLERLRASLLEAHRRDGRLRLKVVCDVFPDFPPLPVERTAWSEETEAADIASMDLGIMPLTDDEWSRGKCGLKALQYMAAGVPVVATPVGINADIVEDGVNGFWARSPEEWVERVLCLAADPGLRRRMGLAGRRTVEARYSLDACLPLLERVLRGPPAGAAPRATITTEEARRP